MEQGPSGDARQSGQIYVAFAALALLAGGTSSYAAGMLVEAFQMQVYAAEALSLGLAGAVLLVFCVARGERLADGGVWSAALILMVPQWCASLLAPPNGAVAPWLHGLGWGAVLLLGVAAPLWVGLASALEVVREETPRVALGAAILGIGAIFLVLPQSSYSLRWNQAIQLTLQVVLGVVTVVTWAAARERISGKSPLQAAACYLILSAAGNAGFALLYERAGWQKVAWHDAWIPLLLDAGLAAVVWWLFFWLLQRMTLVAFSMRPMAVWTTAMLPGFAYAGLVDWRMDAAVTVSLAAVVVGLRARVAEEQPLALGLGGE